MADIVSQKAQLKAIYDQAVAEGDIETANAAVDKSTALDAAPQQDLSTFQDVAAGIPEAITNMATGMVGKVAGDLAGIGTIPYDYFSKKLGFDPDIGTPDDVRNWVRNGLTYIPKSATGKAIAKYNPLAGIGYAVNAGSQSIANSLTEDPTNQQMIANSIPELLSVLGAKYPISKIPLAKTTGKVASFIPETVANVARPHLNPDLSAGMLMNRVAGKRQPSVLQALDDATYNVPSAPGVRQETGISAGQAAVPAGSAEFSALQRAADIWDPSERVAREAAQENNRDLIMSQVQPDLDLATAHRSDVSKPWYKSADASYATIDPSFANILKSMPKAAITNAKNLAQGKQVPFIEGKYAPATPNTSAAYPKISGWNLQNIKTGVADAANNPALKGTAASVSNEVLQNIKDAISSRIPDWDTARQVFKDASAPVNQSNVIQRARDILNGQGGPERMTSFMNITGRGENSFMKKATGYPGAGNIDTILQPNQMAALDEVGRQMVRDKDFDTLATAGTPKVTKVIGDFGTPLETPTIWDQRATIFKSILSKFENAGRDITIQNLAQIMKDPALTAKIMRQATPQQKALLTRLTNTPATGALGAQLGTQNQDNQ